MAGQQQPTQTTQQKWTPEQSALFGMVAPSIVQYANTVPQRYQGNTVAGFTPEQTAGQNQVLGAAPAQQQLATNAANTSNFYTSGNVWDPANNPNLQNAIDAAVRPIYSNLTEKALPAIRSGSIQSGNFGGSRQGIAEAQAIRDASTAAGDTASKLVQNEYDTNVGAQLKALGLVPTTQQTQVTPGVTTSGVGDVRQALDQALINAKVSGFNFDQQAPFMAAKDIMSLIQGMPGQTVSTASVPQANPLMQAIGYGSAVLPFIL